MENDERNAQLTLLLRARSELPAHYRSRMLIPLLRPLQAVSRMEAGLWE